MSYQTIAHAMHLQAACSNIGRQAALSVVLEESAHLVHVALEDCIDLLVCGVSIGRANRNLFTHHERHVRRLGYWQRQPEATSEERQAHTQLTHNPQPEVEQELRRVEQLGLTERVRWQQRAARPHRQPHESEPLLHVDPLLQWSHVDHLPDPTRIHGHGTPGGKQPDEVIIGRVAHVCQQQQLAEDGHAK
eukprot:CAMPEP_0115865200 /NCGR_PEP_ID=MMETSP0287-20121206/19597_1 /TAXON_ID=412157 /ORGANISM="Chrysochromulina rotalis, Strain UIO044" /LENGTH=190 /DNA_ID=CAMNT_0003319701 /DNA_START=376 /DNA_END=948 /DNA_ORIENTATION=+